MWEAGDYSPSVARREKRELPCGGKGEEKRGESSRGKREIPLRRGVSGRAGGKAKKSVGNPPAGSLKSPRGEAWVAVRGERRRKLGEEMVKRSGS